ncbi:MAG TPA: DinB family protein [Actinomycetota bacterium]|nr:DinB family protein [Actinomycetota bacterium]
MDRSIAESLVAEIAFIHTSFLEAVDALDDERFRARPGTKAPAIAFHLWHTARWADMLHGRLGELAPDLERVTTRDQIWDARGLAQAWGLGTELGKGASGMGLDDDASAALRLPDREEVASYAREAFTAAEEVLRSIADAELLLPTADFYDEGDWVVLDHFGWHLTHAARHLGMIEALKGILGLEGTVTV